MCRAISLSINKPMRQDISFTRRGWGLTAIEVLMFDEIISGRQLVLEKLINQSIIK